MGFRDVVDSALSGVKTPVTYAWQSSYGLGSAAVTKINNAVRGGGGDRVEKLKVYMPGPEGQEKIGRALTLVTHPATKELVKLVAPPGGARAYSVVAAVLNNQASTTNAHENKKHEQVMEQLKALRDENDKIRVDLERIKELEYSPNKLNSTTTTPFRFKSSTAVEQTPEEVISVFMMKGLKVRDFLDDQVVPPIRGSMENEQ